MPQEERHAADPGAAAAIDAFVVRLRACAAAEAPFTLELTDPAGAPQTLTLKRTLPLLVAYFEVPVLGSYGCFQVQIVLLKFSSYSLRASAHYLICLSELVRVQAWVSFPGIIFLVIIEAFSKLHVASASLPQSPHDII